MPDLTACALWKDPDATLARAMKDVFSLEWQSPQESHFWRYALKCRDCGQMYFFQFLEDIDWDDGKDAQTTVYVPYAGAEAFAALQRTDRNTLLSKFPQLRRHSPMGSNDRDLRWITDGAGS